MIWFCKEYFLYFTLLVGIFKTTLGMRVEFPWPTQLTNRILVLRLFLNSLISRSVSDAYMSGFTEPKIQLSW